MKYQNKSLRVKIREMFFLLSVLPIIIIMIIGFVVSYFQLRKDSYDKLNVAKETRKKNIVHLYKDVLGDGISLQKNFAAENVYFSLFAASPEYLKRISAQFKENGYELQGEPGEFLGRLHYFVVSNGFADIYYIRESDGKIIFSFEDSRMIGVQLGDAGDDYKNIVKVFQKTKSKRNIYMSDMVLIQDDVPVSLLGVPIMTSDNKISGICILTFPYRNFSDIMELSGDFGETGEVYLVGEDFMFRTPSRFFPRSILKIRVDTESAVRAIRHLTGAGIIKDYRDEWVLSSYTFLGLNDDLNLDFDWIIISEIDVAEAFSRIVNLSLIMALLILLLIAANIYHSSRFTKEITDPLTEIADISDEIMHGNYNVTLPGKQNYLEFIQLSRAFYSVVETFKKVSDDLNELSLGNSLIDIHIEDAHPINQSMKSMVRAIEEFSNQTELVADGNYDVVINPRSEKDRLGNSLKRMTESLKNNHKTLIESDWMRNGRIALIDIARSASDLDKMTFAYLLFLTEYLEGRASIFYVLDHGNSQTEVLRLVSRFGIPDEYLPKMFAGKNDGLIGSMLNENAKINKIKNPDKNYMRYGSGLGEGSSGQLLIVPFVSENKTLGVIELLFPGDISEKSVEFINETSDIISSSLKTALENKKIKELLEKTQQQAEELQAQQEELRVIYEEMTIKNSLLEKQKEEMLINNENLEKISCELENKAKELERSSQYKSEFLSNMSHELRTPLNSLLLLSGKLEKNKEGNLTEKQIQSLKIIHQSGNSLLHMINSILDLAKIEAGKMEVNSVEVNVSGLIDEIKTTFSEQFDENHVELKFSLSENTPENFVSDPHMIIQILRNLISNALKFTHQGYVLVSFAEAKRDDSEYLEMSVKDTGIGIPSEKLNIIFNAFQQADGSTARNYGGTGLGLTITKELTQKLDGFIEVESREGAGSEFRVFIPLNSHIAESSEKKYSSAITGEVQKYKYKDTGIVITHKKTILIVEDDAAYAHLLIDLCRSKGFHCLYASDGETGLGIAFNQHVDAIILDLKLPGIRGEAVLEELKSKEETKNIPIQIISGFSKADNLLRKGAVGYLKKPVSETEIFEALDKIKKIIDQPLSRVLILESETALENYLSNKFKKDILSDSVKNPQQALELITYNKYNCIILDIDIDDFDVFSFFEKMKSVSRHLPPVIIYTKKELTEYEHIRMNEFASSIVIKAGESLERIYSESVLFLKSLNEDKAKNMISGDSVYFETGSLSGLRVLIIDDDMRNLFALSEELEGENIIVTKAPGGKKALTLLESGEKFDIILTDIMMPEMDGYETIRRMRNINSCKNIPVIALTAKAMKEDRDLCMDAGATDYLSKPVSREKLFGMLLKWSGKRKSYEKA